MACFKEKEISIRNIYFFEAFRAQNLQVLVFMNSENFSAKAIIVPHQRISGTIKFL